jgi:hypothetical protein
VSNLARFSWCGATPATAATFATAHHCNSADELMVGAVPADAYDPVDHLALPVIDHAIPELNTGPAAPDR